MLSSTISNSSEGTMEKIHYNQDATDLIAAVKRLGNDDVSRVFDSFDEKRACVARTVLSFLVLIWVSYWYSIGPQEFLRTQAVEVYSASIVIFLLSTIWMFVIRRTSINSTLWIDVIGIVANLVFLAILLKQAFHLLISLNALLPFIAIQIGVRFNKRAFYASIVVVTILLLTTAPEGYWLSRPAYALYAIVLTVALPLLIARILNVLRFATIQSLEAREAQQRFVATISHELRTPLNSLLNSAVLIDPSQLPSEGQALLQTVNYNANALLHRVNDLLDVAAIDGGHITLRTETFYLSDIIQTVQAVCDPLARDKNVSFIINQHTIKTTTLIGDAGRMEQALTNLVQNAIKFTPPGGLVDLAIAETQEATDRYVRYQFRISDTGIGIPDDKKTLVFDPFRQLADGPARRVGGVGLGLYIVRSIAELMDGTIKVADNPTGGSIFTLTVEFAISTDAAMPTRLSTLDALAEHRDRVTSLNCVVFEDTPSIQLVLGRLLNMAGHQATIFQSGADALEKILRLKPDVVFLDLHMPEVSGVDVLQTLATFKNNATKKIHLPPIVVLTADTTRDALHIATTAGTFATLIKPVIAKTLLPILDRVAKIRTRSAA